MDNKQIEVTIPVSLSDVTLDQYFLYVKLLDMNLEEINFAELLITTFCDISLEDLRMLDNSQVNDILRRLRVFLDNFHGEAPFINRFTIKGVEYGFIPNIDKISYGENRDITDNISKGTKEGTAKAMAILYRPIVKKGPNNTYEIEEYTADPNAWERMREMPLSAMLGAQVFFWTLIRDLLLHIPKYLVNQVEEPQLKELIERANIIKNGGLMKNYIV